MQEKTKLCNCVSRLSSAHAVAGRTAMVDRYNIATDALQWSATHLVYDVVKLNGFVWMCT